MSPVKHQASSDRANPTILHSKVNANGFLSVCPPSLAPQTLAKKMPYFKNVQTSGTPVGLCTEIFVSLDNRRSRQ